MNIIVAMDKNGLIGNQGGLPWHLPADLRYFRKMTMGGSIIMGRKTYESLPSHLPGREHIVLSNSLELPWAFKSVEDVQHYLMIAHRIEPFVIGGAQVYQAFLPVADRLYITHIDHEFEGDTHFPDIDWENWTLIESTEGVVDEINIYPHKFCVYERAV